MKAVVMAGGEGSRLRPLTSGIPKPLVPVVGKPVMEHILRLLRTHGITDVVVTLQYLGSAIRDYFGDGSDFGVDITYVVEDSPLGTAGSVKNAQELLDEPFVVISGDAMTDIDLTRVMQYHEEKGAAATIVLTSVRSESTRLNSSHDQISYAVFCLKKKKAASSTQPMRNTRTSLSAISS